MFGHGRNLSSVILGYGFGWEGGVGDLHVGGVFIFFGGGRE